MKIEANKIICSDALSGLKELPKKCIDMCITSPPYWGLRDYQTEGQIGHESTIEDYINNLCDIFDGVWRVLKDTGSVYVNIGDCHAGSGKGIGTDRNKCEEVYTDNYIKRTDWSKIKLPAKCLCGIPERFMIEMIDRGWIRRNTIIWWKRNCMPSNSPDRFTIDFEYIYFFSKQQKYYFEQQFEQYDKPLDRWGGKWIRGDYNTKTEQYAMQEREGRNMRPNPMGRNKRCVWDITTKGFPDAHFATFPEELLETPIKAGCPQYICKRCGKPRIKIYKEERCDAISSLNITKEKGNPRKGEEIYHPVIERIESGYTNCGCNAEFIGGIILDPFVGSGTTAVKAKKMGRRYLGYDTNQDYVNMAKGRVNKIHIKPSIRGKL